MIESDPYKYEEASEYPIWKTTMKEEFHSLQNNDTWDLVIPHPMDKASQV